MRRHPSLIPLSRFHRSGLFVAQMCKRNGPKFKGYPVDAMDKARYALDFFERSLEPHFILEEQRVFPVFTGVDPVLDSLLTTVLDCAEHMHRG